MLAASSASLAIVVATTISGCDNTPTLPVAVTAPASAAPSCPETQPRTPMAPPGPASPLVPPGPVSARLCEYAGLDQQPVNGLAKSADVNGAVLARLVTDVDAVPGGPLKGVTSCPADDGSADLLLFSYPKGQPTVAVVIGLRGCQVASNGTDSVAFFGIDSRQGSAAVGDLTGLLP